MRRRPTIRTITLIGGAETIARFRGRHVATARAGYFDVSMLERVTLAVLYFGLIVDDMASPSQGTKSPPTS